MVGVKMENIDKEYIDLNYLWKFKKYFNIFFVYKIILFIHLKNVPFRNSY